MTFAIDNLIDIVHAGLIRDDVDADRCPEPIFLALAVGAAHG
jgi:hypothetical protein